MIYKVVFGLRPFAADDGSVKVCVNFCCRLTQFISIMKGHESSGLDGLFLC